SEGWYFFEIEASGSWHKLDLTESSQEVKVSVTLQAAAVVGVTPGSWYNGGYLRKLALDPHAFTTPYAPSGGESPVFGEGGLLPLSVVGLVVGYQPSFRIEMDQAAYDHHLQEFSGSGGIRIGPFVFGGSGRHVTDNWTKTHDNRVYEGTSTATYPVLLGVIVTRPGLD
ncbi:MAG: hypothetical protein NTZ05_23045, partial [Chloroflexi bacterium]|nr:hypothetical protein [Chloroflexota bacterium]